jgi:hypothetical protein
MLFYLSMRRAEPFHIPLARRSLRPISIDESRRPPQRYSWSLATVRRRRGLIVAAAARAPVRSAGQAPARRHPKPQVTVTALWGTAVSEIDHMKGLG